MQGTLNIGLVCIGCVLFFSGCQSLVTQQIETAESYPFNNQMVQQMKAEYGLERKRSCWLENQCYSYLYAPEQSTRQHMKTTIEADFTGKSFESKLHITRDKLPAFSGNVIILHGFRGSKEWMAVSAAYFQFLGFNVFIPDLLGHGESNQAKGFGVKDVDYLLDFIDREISQNTPILIVGNSMGALPALNLATKVASLGVILQAPMIRFDKAVPAYLNDISPWYQFMLSDQVLADGAAAALVNADIELSSTDISTSLRTISIPTLIFASNTDSVAPYAKYQTFDSELIKVIEVKNRQHAYMSMIGQEEHQVIVDWMEKWGVGK